MGIQVKGFPSCCGAATLSHLYLNGNYSNYHPSVEAGLTKFLTKGEGDYTGPGYADGRPRSVAIAITIARQTKAIELLKNKKAIAVATFVNANTGDTNTIWVLPVKASAKLKRVSAEKPVRKSSKSDPISF